jgi:hypothetical protein
MKDTEGPTFSEALFGILLGLFVFTAIELSGKDTRGKTITQLCGICLPIGAILTWYGILGLKQALVGFPMAYVIHSFTFGLLMLRRASPPSHGPL